MNRTVRIILMALSASIIIVCVLTNTNHLLEPNMLMLIGISIFALAGLWQITEWIEDLREKTIKVFSKKE